ncbi:MAG: hypothetical protein IT328_09800 [Caldilineaceae bacterium]|nr:hypothetical protein [Caldilineaceae bacterium]
MIRPFQFGDIVLIQRLGRQSTKLDVVQSLLQPQSAIWASLSAIIPWNDAKVTTYVLRQQGHGLVGIGYLQVQKRPGRPEAEITSLAPGLDAARGHPVIWEKLLSYYNAVAAQQQITRIYVDVPDQPLPVNTFSHVGFRTYARQSIWRLARHELTTYPHPNPTNIRPQTKADEWALRQLYTRVVPQSVQVAEGVDGPTPVKPPILDWWQVGASSSFVLEQRGDVVGAVQIVYGQRGYWLQLWADFYNPDSHVVHQLVRHSLATIAQEDVQRSVNQPVYVGVCDYHGSLGTLLSDYGFAPITDRAKMVRPVMQWVRELALEPSVILKRTAPVIGAPFILPTPPESPLPRSRVLIDAGVTKGNGGDPPVRRVGVHPAAQADLL